MLPEVAHVHGAVQDSVHQLAECLLESCQHSLSDFECVLLERAHVHLVSPGAIYELAECLYSNFDFDCFPPKLDLDVCGDDFL